MHGVTGGKLRYDAIAVLLARKISLFIFCSGTFPGIRAENFRFCPFSEIFDQGVQAVSVTRKPCYVLVRGLMASYCSFPPVTPYWDGSGRRYLLRELEDAKQGLLNPVAPSLVVLDFGSIENYDIPEGFGFRVHKQDGRHSRYLGRYSGDPYAVKEWLQEKHGGGKYTLRLIDSVGNLTRYKFSLVMDGPPRVDDEAGSHREAEARELPGETPVRTRTLRTRLVDVVKATLQSVR